jgi:D-glycerate 3-kinase
MGYLLKPSRLVADGARMVDDQFQTSINVDLTQVLHHVALSQELSRAERVYLETALLSETWQHRRFALTAETVATVVEQRTHLVQALYPELSTLCCDRWGWSDCRLDLLWRLWLPLALDIATYHQQQEKPIIQGILGVQGTGKTTLAAIVSLILNHLGCRVCSLSLDDLYKTYDERRQLQLADPRLRWRGPPGTHDIELGLTTLQTLRHARPTDPVQIPRFDKAAHTGAGDRTTPDTVSNIDVVLFEGWFVGVRPIDPTQFDTAPPPILTESDRQFARDCNTRLHDYVPLWEQLDRLMVLYPTDYRLSQQWRQQAEHQMMATGCSGMTNDEINQFVEYFWRSLHPELFIKPLLHDARYVDLVVEVNPDHSPNAIYAVPPLDAF